MYGDDCVPLVICGCGANIDHSDPLNPSHIDTTERMGAILAEATVPVLKRLVYQDDSRLDYAIRKIKIPLRRVPEHELAEAKALLAEHPVRERRLARVRAADQRDSRAFAELAGLDQLGLG